MKNQSLFKILPIDEQHIESYRLAVGSVARELKYLAFIDTPSLESSRTFVVENIKTNRPHFVALINEEIVGWCDISSLHRPALEHVGCLGVGVVSEYRGQGIGAALIRASLTKAQYIGLTRIELTVRENNARAIALYEKLGFKVEGRHPNAIRINGQYEHQLSMGLLFI